MTDNDHGPFDPRDYYGRLCDYCGAETEYYPPYLSEEGGVFCGKCDGAIWLPGGGSLITACRGLLDDIKGLERRNSDAVWWRRHVRSLVRFRHRVLRLEDMLTTDTERAELREACRELLRDVFTIQARQPINEWWWRNAPSRAHNLSLVCEILINES